MSSALSAGSATPAQVSPDQFRDRWRLYFCAVLAGAAILLFARLGDRALWSSEFRWAEIAREMLATRDYFWPTINGKVYYDKPLGSYWVVVWSSFATGGLNEVAARIPSALSGLLSVAFLMLIARRLYDARTAILSGLVLATSFSFVFYSRHASADIETIAGELAALLLFLRNERSRGGWWVVGLWLIMAATSLTKGLLGFILPVMTIGSFCVLAEGWRELGNSIGTGALSHRVRWIVERNRWLFNWYSVVAIALGLAVYYAPFAVSHSTEGSERGLEMVWRENVVRFFRPFDHRGPIYLYVYVIFALMAPWAMLLPAALVEAHQRRHVHAEPARSDRFVLVFFWATFIFFTLSGSRRSYYILPILPAGAVLVARLLCGPELLSKWSQWLLKVGYGLFVLLAVLGILVLLPPSLVLRGQLGTLPPAPSPVFFAAAWIVCVVGIVYALRRLRRERIAVSMGIVAYLGLIYLYVFAMPAADTYRGEKPFALRTLETVGGDTTKLAFYRTQGPLFYLNPPTPLRSFDRPADLASAIQRDEVRWIVVRRRDLKGISAPSELKLSEASFPWESSNQVRNKVVLVEIKRP